jgi:hypothetical protein
VGEETFSAEDISKENAAGAANLEHHAIHLGRIML